MMSGEQKSDRLHPARAEYALTLWPEWAAAIVLLGKRVENRTWRAPKRIVGRRIAIHAGASVGGRKGKPARREALEALRSIEGVTEEQAQQCIAYADRWAGHVVCTAVVMASNENDVMSPLMRPCNLRWCVPGVIGWRLADVRILEVPQPATGKQGIWTWEAGDVQGG